MSMYLMRQRLTVIQTVSDIFLKSFFFFFFLGAVFFFCWANGAKSRASLSHTRKGGGGTTAVTMCHLGEVESSHVLVKQG